MSYAKDLWKYLDGLKFPPGNPKRFIVESTQNHLFKGEKFMLPVDGVIMDDPEQRGLELDEPLHMPFDSMVLQFKTSLVNEAIDQLGGQYPKVSKGVVVVRKDYRGVLSPEMNHQDWLDYHDPVFVTTWVYEVSKHRWASTAAFLMPTKNWNAGRYEDGGVKFKVFMVMKPGLQSIPVEEVRSQYQGGETVTPYGVEPIVELLNALACSNITKVKKRTDKPKEGKPPLPFSETWELMVELPKKQKLVGSIQGNEIFDRRSPREHMRRGHIRKYENGNRIWVNAAIISAGKGGKISKEYVLKK